MGAGKGEGTDQAGGVEDGVADGADGGAVLQGVAAGDEEEVDGLELGGEREEAPDARLIWM